jgi:hypothetical protein
MAIRRLMLLAGALAASSAGCRDATPSSDPSGIPIQFDARGVPAERSAVYAVTAERLGNAVVVRGGFFIGADGYVLSARAVRVASGATRLEVTAVPRPLAKGPAPASHYDYEAVLPAAQARELTVTHARAGGPAETVFRKRVY